MSNELPAKPHLAAPRSDIGVAWFVKRTIMAVAILCVSIGGIAWLLHASIDPTAEAKAANLGTPSSVLSTTGSISKN